MSNSSRPFSSSSSSSSTSLIVPADLHIEDVAEKYESLRWGNVFDRLYDPTTYTGVYAERFRSGPGINGDTEMKPYSHTTTYSGDTNEGSNEKIRDIKYIMRPNLNRSDRSSPFSPTARAAAKSRIRYDAAEQALQSALRGDIKLINDAFYEHEDTMRNRELEDDTSFDTSSSSIPTLDANLMLSILFQYYCRFGKGSNQNDESLGGSGSGLSSSSSSEIDLLDLANFAKFTRDSNEVAGLLDSVLNPTEVDLLFIKVRKHHPRKIQYDEWLQVLSAMSSYKYGDLTIDPAEAFIHFLNKYVFTVPAAICIARSIKANLVKVEPINTNGIYSSSSSSSLILEGGGNTSSLPTSISLHNHYKMPTSLSVTAPLQEKKDLPAHHSASNAAVLSTLRASAGPFSAAAVAVGISPSAVRGRRLVPQNGASAHELLQSGLLSLTQAGEENGSSRSEQQHIASSSSSSSSSSLPLPSFSGSPRIPGVPNIVESLPGYDEAMRAAAFAFATSQINNTKIMTAKQVNQDDTNEGKKEDDNNEEQVQQRIVSTQQQLSTLSSSPKSNDVGRVSLTNSSSSFSSSSSRSPVTSNTMAISASPTTTSSAPYQTRLSAVTLPTTRDPTDPSSYLSPSQRSLTSVHKMVPPSDAFQLLQRMAVEIYSKQKAAAATTSINNVNNNSSVSSSIEKTTIPGAFMIPTSPRSSSTGIDMSTSSNSLRVGRPFSPSLVGPSGADLLGLSKIPSYRISSLSTHDTKQALIGSDGQPLLPATDFTYSPRPVSALIQSNNTLDGTSRGVSSSRSLLSSSSSSPRSPRRNSALSINKNTSPRPRMGEPGFRPSVAGEANIPGGLFDRLSSPSNFTGVYKIGYRSPSGYTINHYADKSGKGITGLTSDIKTNEAVHDFSAILRPAVDKTQPKGPFRP